jgi:hypothetical protein
MFGSNEETGVRMRVFVVLKAFFSLGTQAIV